MGISDGLLLVAVTVKVCSELGSPVVMPDRLIVCAGAFAGIEKLLVSVAGLVIGLIVGALLGLTVTVNVIEATSTPPLAVPPLSTT